MDIKTTIRQFYGQIQNDPHHRYCSWEHCHDFFQRNTAAGISAQPDLAALHLGFYLASWGMYRGSTFLLQHTYTIHRDVIKSLVDPELRPLWETEFGSDAHDARLVPTIMSAIQAVRDAYKRFHVRQASDTLVTKILLGTFGCLPACDQNFVSGFRSQGRSYSRLNVQFVDNVRQFCNDNIAALRDEQRRIEDVSQVHYPLMKLIDMHFWQIGANNRR